MYKITIVGIVEYMLKEVEKVGKIEYIDQCRRTFTATFDGCTVKVKGEMVRIKNPKNHAVVCLLNFEFEEMSII